jgi:hypothetical protein
MLFSRRRDYRGVNGITGRFREPSQEDIGYMLERECRQEKNIICFFLVDGLVSRISQDRGVSLHPSSQGHHIMNVRQSVNKKKAAAVFFLSTGVGGSKWDYRGVLLWSHGLRALATAEIWCRNRGRGPSILECLCFLGVLAPLLLSFGSMLGIRCPHSAERGVKKQKRPRNRDNKIVSSNSKEGSLLLLRFWPKEACVCH